MPLWRALLSLSSCGLLGMKKRRQYKKKKKKKTKKPQPEKSCYKDKSVSSSGSKKSLGGVECCICFEKLTRSNKAILNPCLHSDFHETCITQWLSKKNECPFCGNVVCSILYNLKRRGRNSYQEKFVALPFDQSLNQDIQDLLMYEAFFSQQQLISETTTS